MKKQCLHVRERACALLTKRLNNNHYAMMWSVTIRYVTAAQHRPSHTTKSAQSRTCSSHDASHLHRCARLQFKHLFVCIPYMGWDFPLPHLCPSDDHLQHLNAFSMRPFRFPSSIMRSQLNTVIVKSYRTSSFSSTVCNLFGNKQKGESSNVNNSRSLVAPATAP